MKLRKLLIFELKGETVLIFINALFVPIFGAYVLTVVVVLRYKTAPTNSKEATRHITIFSK